MNTISPAPRPTMGSHFQPESKGRGLGLPLVVGLHLVVGYALVSGLGSSALQVVKKPLEAVLIQEVVLPPPPPPPPPPPTRVVRQATPPPRSEAPPPPFVPPPEVAAPPSQAPAIVASSTPPTRPVEIAPPAPPAPPPAPPAPPAAPAQQEIGAACPTQVKPEIPARAMDEAVSGIVRAQATIRGQAVDEVKILSGPRVYHAAVRRAMLQYRCTAPDGTVAVQEFHFKFE